MTKFIKALMLASVALFFTLVAYGNITDYATNWHFVQHVLSMDTIPKNPALKARAIHDIEVQHFAYSLIIAWEALTALICWVGVISLLKNCQSARAFSYKKAKQVAVLGLGLGFLLYMVGFMDIGGEWFAMWQSKTWNGQQTAGLFSTLIMLVLIFIALPEPE